jgi:hypothetical protein
LIASPDAAWDSSSYEVGPISMRRRARENGAFGMLLIVPVDEKEESHEKIDC